MKQDVEDILNNIKTVKRKSTIRFSNNYIPDTNINGLSQFDDFDFEEYNQDYGNIERMYSENKDLIVFQKKVPFNILDWCFGWLFHLMYIILVKIMKKRFRIDDNCNLCKLCVKICPVNALAFTDEFLLADYERD